MHAAQALLCITQVSAQRLRQVTGVLAACHSLVLLCMFHLCPLLILLRDHFTDQADASVISSGPVISGLLVSVGTSLPGSSSPAASPTHVLITDTTNYGWGSVCGPLLARGVWSRNHVGLHINYLELETVFLALKRFQRWLCGTHVLVHTDSTMVMHYLIRIGGPGPGVWTDWFTT